MLTFYQAFAGADYASGVRLRGTDRYDSRTQSTGYPLEKGMHIAFWYRRDADNLQTANQTMIGSQVETLTDQGYASTRVFGIRAQPTGIDFLSLAQTAPNSSVAASWDLVVDSLWHHVMVRIEEWSGSFPGVFKIRLYHDGVDRGLVTTGGPSTYNHTNYVSSNYYSQLGQVYPYTGYTNVNFIGDMAQIWIGTTDPYDPDWFQAREFFDRGPVNLNPFGIVRGLLPYHYDPVDFPFANSRDTDLDGQGDLALINRMFNTSDRSTRTPVISDAADGIQYVDTDLSQSTVVCQRASSNDTIQPGRYEFGWGDVSVNTYNTLKLEIQNLYRAIKINQSGYYRVNITGTIRKNKATAGSITIELRSDYSPFQSQAGAVNSGTQVIVSPRLVQGYDPGSGDLASTVNISQRVYLQGYLGLVHQVYDANIEWRNSDLTIEILTDDA